MNLLPLDTFRSILKYPPFQFWGMDNEDVSLGSQCNQVVTEYAYQANNVGGRADIRDAIVLAEKKLRSYLSYPVAPQYIEEEIPYPSYLDQRLIRTFPSDPTGGWVSVQLPDGNVQAIGIESLTLIDDPAVVYSDEFGTGVNDTFTITLATTETDESKIAVYFQASDRIDNEPVSEKYRINPVQVQITGGVATIIGRAWLMVKPILYQAPTRQQVLNPATAANFVTNVEVYVRTTDPTGTTVATAQGMFSWDSNPDYGWWGFCCQNSTDPAAVATAIARVGIRNGKLGIVLPGEAVYNETTSEWNMTVPPWSGVCRPPNKVTIRYLAGYPLENNQMDARFARAVAYLAMAELPERICACDNANRTLYKYQLPLNQTGSDQETFAVTRSMLNCPLGNRWGHWYAWNEIMDLALVRGVSPS